MKTIRIEIEDEKVRDTTTIENDDFLKGLMSAKSVIDHMIKDEQLNYGGNVVTMGCTFNSIDCGEGVSDE